MILPQSNLPSSSAHLSYSLASPSFVRSPVTSIASGLMPPLTSSTMASNMSGWNCEPTCRSDSCTMINGAARPAAALITACRRAA